MVIHMASVLGSILGGGAVSGAIGALKDTLVWIGEKLLELLKEAGRYVKQLVGGIMRFTIQEYQRHPLASTMAFNMLVYMLMGG